MGKLFSEQTGLYWNTLWGSQGTSEDVVLKKMGGGWDTLPQTQAPSQATHTIRASILCTPECHFLMVYMHER